MRQGKPRNIPTNSQSLFLLQIRTHFQDAESQSCLERSLGVSLQKVDIIHAAICFAFSFISSFQSSEIQLFCLRIAVEAIFCSSLVNRQLGGSSWKEVLPKQPRFHANIRWINLVCQQIYHRIDGILLASSKFGQGH